MAGSSSSSPWATPLEPHQQAWFQSMNYGHRGPGAPAGPLHAPGLDPAGKGAPPPPPNSAPPAHAAYIHPPGARGVWDDVSAPPRAPGGAPAAPGGAAAAGAPPYVPPTDPLTTLGWLKHLHDPHVLYFEWHYLKIIHKFLTKDWYLIQGGSCEQALAKWLEVFDVLELDLKARRDLMLLAQTGNVGRTHANKIMWTILSGPALEPKYLDISNLVTSMVFKARRDFDRPPREHGDLSWWWWTCYEHVYRRDLKWCPAQVPTSYWVLSVGPGERPLAPPACWGSQPAR